MSALPKLRSAASLPISFIKARSEHQRWLCLTWLDISRPTPMTDGALLPLMRTEYPDATRLELQRHLDYLRKAELLTITEDVQNWSSQLTRQGIDFVEYTTPATPGIGRPQVIGE